MEYDELVAIAKPIVWRRGHRLSVQDREDLLQEVLIKYMNAWPDGTSPDNPAAWFETATPRAVIDRLRADGRRPADNFAEGGDDPFSLAMAALRSTGFASLEPVRQELITKVFALIPEADSDLLRRRYLDNDSAADIADELGISVASVDQRSSRAKKKLRESLLERPDLMRELRAAHPHVY